MNLSEDRYGVAIVLQVADDGWRLVNEGVIPLTRPLHVTIAYLEVLGQGAAEQVAELGKAFLAAQLMLQHCRFCTVDCEPLFDIVTGLVPTASSAEQLRELNGALERHLALHGFPLNNHTSNGRYHPHMTLRRRIFVPEEYEQINLRIRKLSLSAAGGLCLRLDRAAAIVRKLED